MKFEDLGYLEKRKHMRRYVINHVDVQEIISYVIYHSVECVMPFKMNNSDKENLLYKLLVDGYASFEKIYNNNQLIGYEYIDPTTLTYTQNNWIQYEDDLLLKNTLSHKQVLYLSFAHDWMSNTTSSISLVDVIMNQGLTMKNANYLNIIADYSYKILTDFDSKLLRRAKLERILEK